LSYRGSFLREAIRRVLGIPGSVFRRLLYENGRNRSPRHWMNGESEVPDGVDKTAESGAVTGAIRDCAVKPNGTSSANENSTKSCDTSAAAAGMPPFPSRYSASALQFLHAEYSPFSVTWATRALGWRLTFTARPAVMGSFPWPSSGRTWARLPVILF
jgi:hypothetical protein